MALPQRLAIITSQAFSLTNFRGALIAELVRHGVEVFALAPDFTDDIRTSLRVLGATPVDFSLTRTGINPVRDVIDSVKLAYLLRYLKVDASLAYFIKPVIFGTLAAWSAGVGRRIALLEGLGFIFVDDTAASVKRRILKKLVMRLYRISLKRAHKVILLNNDDLADLKISGALDPNKAVVLSGIGVNLDYFCPTSHKPVQPTFVLIARMLRSKGILEFVKAAELVKAKYPCTRFVLVGGTDANPDSVSEEALSRWHREGTVVWSGHVKDVRTSLENASVFVLPSYYREGLPRSIQEAMAMAKPIITTSVPGCRDTVVEGVNGFLIPPRDPKALAASMMRFIENPESVSLMGAESRKLAELRYNERAINSQLLCELQLV